MNMVYDFHFKECDFVCKYSFVTGDITKINTEAIVNSANTMMVKGSGICNSIFEAGRRKRIN